jgi:hypothetical protein
LSSVGKSMRRFLRYLRIAFSATCAIACVLLIVLWVRSYWRIDYICIPLNHNQGMFGNLMLGMMGVGTTAHPEQQIITSELNVEHVKFAADRFRSLYPYGFGASSTAKSTFVVFPFWLAVVCSAAFAVAPWYRLIPYRFTLRTLLIATTLVAVVLGLIVWLR